jgi:hypothetical protein
VVSDDPAVGGLVLPSGPFASTVSIVSGENGSSVVSWLVFPDAPDAGGGLGFADATPVIPSRAEVALLGTDGTLTSHTSFALPSALAARRGGVTSVGVNWTGEGVLFNWIEAVDSTAADGATTSTQTLKLQFVATDGSNGNEIAPAHAECAQCTLFASLASFDSGVSVLYAGTPLPATASTPTAGFAQLSSSGELVASGALPWLIPALDAGGTTTGSPPSVQAPGSDLLVVTATQAWNVDPDLTRGAGPLAIPEAGTVAVSWNAAANDAVLAWTAPFGVDGGVGDDPDLYFQRADNSGRPTTTVERISTGTSVYAVLADGAGSYGVLFFASDVGHDYFDFVDATGAKRGGDLDLGLTGVSAVTSYQDLHALSALGPGRFLDVYLGNSGNLGRREVLCAP